MLPCVIIMHTTYKSRYFRFEWDARAQLDLHCRGWWMVSQIMDPAKLNYYHDSRTIYWMLLSLPSRYYNSSFTGASSMEGLMAESIDEWGRFLPDPDRFPSGRHMAKHACHTRPHARSRKSNSISIILPIKSNIISIILPTGWKSICDKLHSIRCYTIAISRNLLY